ncbi:sialoadhesin-like isoform X3 [Anguilla rostrata]
MEPFAWVLLYGVCFQGAIFGVSWAWSVTVPREMEGMVGSCLVIPCRFSYSEYPPNDKGRVVWYQYVDRGYPLVCDPKNPNEVIEKFRGKTSLYGSPYEGDCSLKIDPLHWGHQEERVYPWVDPDYITYRYFKFYDKAVKIRVRDRVDKPEMQIIGIPKVGEQISVQCSAYHTCPATPPELSLIGFPETGQPRETQAQDVKWKTTLVQTWVIVEDQQTVSCRVRHPGGQEAQADITIQAECSVGEIITDPGPVEFLEGVVKNVTCSVFYTCSKQQPAIVWNYKDIPASSSTTKMAATKWKTVSSIMFIASMDDHGKTLTCTAEFPDGKRPMASIDLHVKRAMFSLGWSFSMPSQVTGLQGSCLVIPCHFEYSSTLPSDVSVMWYKYTQVHGEYPVVYSPARPGDVISDFSGKTSLYGSPSNRSCSLKINPVEMNHHRQRLYTWVDPKPISSYHRQNYQDKTVEIYVTDRVDKPEMQIIGIPKVGEQISMQCSAYHMCPATPPELSLIGFPETGQAHETQAQDVKWKTTLVQTWVIVEDQQTVSCRVRHPGGQEAQADITIQAECSVGEIITDPGPVEFLEGVVKNVTCSVFYTCSKQQPAIVWNYKDIPASSSTTKMAATKWKTVSSIMFIASMDDHGKTLTCTAQFPDGKRPMTSIDLHVKSTYMAYNY